MRFVASFVFLFLFLSLDVSAATFYTSFVNGDIASSVPVLCERERRFGVVSISKENVCCVDVDDNGFCAPDEPQIGRCSRNNCIWPTHSFLPSFTHKLKYVSCDGLVVTAGSEYSDLLSVNSCVARDDVSYCCPVSAFPQKSVEVASPRQVQSSDIQSSSLSGLIIISNSEWDRALHGSFNPFISAAVAHEFNRCSKNPSRIRSGDSSVSVFADSKSIRSNQRVFRFNGSSIETLAGWC